MRPFTGQRREEILAELRALLIDYPDGAIPWRAWGPDGPTVDPP